MGSGGYSFFYWGANDRKKGMSVFLPFNLTMVVNSTNIIMKCDTDFRIMIL